MACDCPAFECIEVYVSPCDTGVDTGIVAPADGVYFVRLKFNHAFSEYSFELEADETLILPNVVNGNYVHELQVYRPDGTLLNDTCYNLDVRTVINAGNGLTPSPIGDPYRKIITSDVDSTSLTDAFFGTGNITEITTLNQSYIVGVDFTQTGATITWTNGMSFYIGQVIIAKI